MAVAVRARDYLVEHSGHGALDIDVEVDVHVIAWAGTLEEHSCVVQVSHRLTQCRPHCRELVEDG